MQLYQRRKGRDLFDLYWAMIHQDVNTEKLISCYKTYMEYSVGKPPSQKQFLANMEEKLLDGEFMEDIHAVLKPVAEYDNGQGLGISKKEIGRKSIRWTIQKQNSKLPEG